MLPGKKLTPEDILKIAKRRGWMVVLPLSIGIAIAPMISAAVPKRYKSETLIRVIPQRVPDSYVKSTVTERMEERLPSISSVILSRSRLERIIKDFGLYGDQGTRGSMEELVQRLQRDIDVKPDGQESFRVTYVSNSPQIAQKITARLASLYIEENLRDRASLADETNAFLESQLRDAKERLIEHEKKLEQYRREHAGELPSQLESNLQTIRNAQMQMQSLIDTANRIRERRLLVERQLADLQSLPAEAASAIEGGDRANPAGLSTAQQLAAARAKLEADRLRFAPDHPDIRAEERTVQELDARLQEERKNPAPPAADSAQVFDPAQLARQKRIRDLQSELDVIDHQLTASLAEESRLKEVMAAYQAKVDVVPTRESELVELTRDYSTIQTAYMNLLTKREDSKIAANLERREIGEQFRIVDAASLPEKPYNRNQRLAIIASGAVAGLVLGLLLIVLLEYRDSSFTREEDVARLLSLPVLAMVPVIHSNRERRRQRLKGVGVNVAAVSALLGSIAIVVVWRLTH